MFSITVSKVFLKIKGYEENYLTNYNRYIKYCENGVQKVFLVGCKTGWKVRRKNFYTKIK